MKLAQNSIPLFSGGALAVRFGSPVHVLRASVITGLFDPMMSVTVQQF
jgi:hypothetical protein